MSKLILLSLPFRRWSGPGWYGIERMYQHATLGKLLIPTIVREGAGADVVILRHISERQRWNRRVEREHAQKQPRRKGKPGGSKRPPAAPRGGGKAA